MHPHKDKALYWLNMWMQDIEGISNCLEFIGSTGHIAAIYIVGKPERKKTLGKPNSKWACSIKMDFREDGVMYTGFIWLRIGTSGGIL
jgi:hypothetical protein